MLDGDQDRTNPFAAARGDKRAICGLLLKYFGHLLSVLLLLF